MTNMYSDAHRAGKDLNCADRRDEEVDVAMDRESTPEATPERIETTHGAVENARQELRELKRTLLLSKLRETKEPSLPEPTADAPTRGRQ